MGSLAIAQVAILAWLSLATALPISQAYAQAVPPTRYEVQSAYLLNFAKFARWPAGEEEQPLTLCVAGQKVYTDTLTRIVAGERIDQRPVSVRAIAQPGDEAGCDILFLDSALKDGLASYLTAAAGKPMLTVSDAAHFCDHGGMIQFLLLNDRVRFSVDLKPLAQSGISLSSALLKVAVAVTGLPASGQPVGGQIAGGQIAGSQPTSVAPATAKTTVAKPTVAKPTVVKTTVAKPTVAKTTVVKPTVVKTSGGQTNGGGAP